MASGFSGFGGFGGFGLPEHLWEESSESVEGALSMDLRVTLVP